MGIKGLWKVLLPAEQERSLLQLATREGFMRHQSKRYFVIGIDMNLWIDRCQAAFHGAGLHTHAGENPELRACFWKLCHLLKLPVVPVFVPDGDRRPAVKRDHIVKTKPVWIMDYAKDLIRAFGFHLHQAPGEADAELAKLNELGFIDAILTEDSDTLVFGGQCILRSISKTPDRVFLYAADTIELTTTTGQSNLDDSVGLTRGGLLLFALLSGGDYDTKGVPGCGGAVACGLAQCGFGDTLLDALNSASGQPLEAILKHWRQGLRNELVSNSQRRLSRTHPNLAQNINDAFPSRSVMNFYLNPVTSWSPESGYKVPDASTWRICEPNVPQLTAFCTRHLGWARNAVILQKFSGNLWEGVACRMLYSPVLQYDNKTARFSTAGANMAAISQSKSRTNKTAIIPSCRLVVSTSNFRMQMGNPWNTVATTTENDTVPVKVPIEILEAIAPQVLEIKGPKTSPSPRLIMAHTQQVKSAVEPRITSGSSTSMIREVIEVSDSEHSNSPTKSGKQVANEVIELTDSENEVFEASTHPTPSNYIDLT
ncbi:hypothetical protein DXG01_001554 [Tephrocybe rancida]|nr:hypothetical protein DXG01_001554 [Tephrocybe rancida]